MNSVWDIRFYENSRGDKLVLDFIKAQDTPTQAKLAKLLDLIKIYGPDLGMPYAKFVGKGLYELRVRGRNEVRVFYVLLDKRRTVILLHAFKKRTQKLPVKELDIARARQKELTTI